MIITFYSYKGGVGRTMALANIAELFFRSGRKVLMVDWDLEAPGLDRYFFKDDSLEDLLEKPGLVDMILDYKEKMMQKPTPADKNTDKTLPFKELDHFLVDIYPDVKNGGKLWLLPPGRRSTEHFAKYANTVITFDWKDFYENWAGELYFEWLRRQFENKADVILIDSRTGLTEIGGVCTYQLADIIIMLCGTNQQNIDGTYRMVKNFTSEEIKKLRTDRPLDILVVPARTEVAEGGKLNDFKVQFIEKFTQFMPPTVISDIWDLRIPYIPFYAYSEAAAVREGSRAVAEEIAESYNKIYEVLTTEYKKSSREAIDVISKTDVNKENEIIKQDEGENEFEPLDMADSIGISADITILHLSELHFKLKRHEKNITFQRNIQKELVTAVKAHLAKHKSPDFVVVTGDIAFSGKKHEYEEAVDFFTKLKSILPAETQFLVVPGNHDADRDQVDEVFSLHRIVIEDKIDKFLESKKQIKHFINSKFKAFRDFCHRLNPSLYQSRDDYFWVTKFKEKNVAFLGLNSAWASEGDNDRFNIALGYRQVKDALKQSADIPNRIALLHHSPFNWLKDMEFGKSRVELFTNCALLLHSHTHVDDALTIKTPVTESICLGSNASYTSEKEGFIGFQFLRVQFKEKAEGIRIIVWPYIFDKRISRFLPDKHRWPGQYDRTYFILDTNKSKSDEKSSLSASLNIPGDYKMWVKEFHSTLPTDQLARKGEVILISLPQVYIPLETSNPFHKYLDEKRMKGEYQSLLEDSEEEIEKLREPTSINIEELVGRVDCLLLEGQVGMGKTTLIKHLAYSITHDSGPATLKGYLPVLVFLKDFWPIYQKKLQKEWAEITFESLLEDYFSKSRCPLTIETVNGFLSKGRVLFLLDGLDEVPDTLRDSLVDLIHRFQFRHNKNRFLITGRPHGIEGKGVECFGDNHRCIEPLYEKKVETFISKWFRAVSGQAEGFAGVNAADLISDIRVHEHSTVFTQNPLLLTALCVFYLVGGKRIPDQRADLYDRIVANLLYRRFHDPTAPEKVNAVWEYLMLMAFNMQTRHIKSIEAFDAKELLKEKYPKMGDESRPVYQKRIKELFDGIEPVCGLLNRVSSGDIEFSHLSFQEFLAAKYMLDMDIDYKISLEGPWWEECLLIYTGLMNLEMKKRSNEIVKEMLYMKPLRLQLLGSRALRDFPYSKREEAAVTTAREKLITLIDSDVSLEERFEAGEILGSLGDPRIQPPPMVCVEAGKFTRGSMENENEQPIRQIYLDEYMIGKYPVTNEKFKAFMSDDGYKEQEYWTPEGWEWLKKENVTEPRYWHDRKWNGANFPVVGVSWYEASAYAEWLSQKTGDKYALPTEAQWEKAARGSKGLVYPWGNKFDKNLCNSDECGLNRTNPVGIFPTGTSPYGCYDMVGNVWEWCCDWYEENYYKKSPAKNPTGPSSGSHRVIKGGSWLFNAWHSRAASRNYVYPAFRDLHLGFRIVRSF